MKKIIYIVIVFAIVSCKSKQIEPHDPVKDLPKEINERFVIPRVNTKETALAICRLLIKEQNEKIKPTIYLL